MQGINKVRWGEGTSVMREVIVVAIVVVAIVVVFVRLGSRAEDKHETKLNFLQKAAHLLPRFWKQTDN